MKIIGSDKGIHSPEFHKKKTRQKRIKQAIVSFIVIVAIALPIYLAHLHSLLITNIEVSGNEVTRTEDIERIIVNDLSGSYVWVFPRSNTAIYPKATIIHDLLAQESRLSSVSVERVGAKGLKVSVTERSPVAEYCKDVSDPETPQDCYFIDDTGYIFAPAPAFSGNVYLTYAISDTLENPIGQTVLPADEFGHTRTFVQSLTDLGIYARVFLIKMDEYHLLLSNGAEILWEKSTDLNLVHTNLASFLSDKTIADDSNFLSRVAYIDMRFGSKIFYKFRGE